MIKNIPDPQRIRSIVCQKCATSFIVTHLSHEPKFCVACGMPLKNEESDETKEGHISDTEETNNLVAGHEPLEESVKFTVGNYKIISDIGRGGMGEVFLAYDPIAGRRIALKKIREDFKNLAVVESRFIKEARITSQLTHPAIIPIYSINAEPKNVFYTMPYVEGETLKQILRRARQEEKKGRNTDPRTSIPSLTRIFITICQAIAYAHAKQVLHRDLKPENIIVGKFGEVLILDWGLAKMWEGSIKEPVKMVKGTKLVGTLAYMPPERAHGIEATPQSDIYALGVILYQILTLKMPFVRDNIKNFRKIILKEKLIEPSELSPWREVPRILSRIVMKCLEPDPLLRYETVAQLISDLESYIEGRAEFFPIASLNIHQKEDWEFQENVLIAEHIALTRNVEHSTWINLMISKESFSENLRLEATITPGPNSSGLGFLLSVPESSERSQLIEGFCLWLGTKKGEKTRLLKSTVEVLEAPHIILETEKETHVKIEKVDNHIHVWINGHLELTYVSHIPIAGTHIGVILRDFDLVMQELIVYEGSQNILVNCLAVPDAFLSNKNYTKALSEYRRIAYSFPGRSEGREAAFRAGITLLEQGVESTDIKQAHILFEEALLEFEKLHSTPGAPLEYLGKALVYNALSEYEEEIKCFELAFRRYPNHPLQHVLEEQILFRMHDSSKIDRKAAYAFLLLILQYLRHQMDSPPVRRVLDSIYKHAEPLWFIESPPALRYDRRYWGILLAYSLAKPYVIDEIMKGIGHSSGNEFKEDDLVVLNNGIWALKELGAEELAAPYLKIIKLDPEKEKYWKLKNWILERKVEDVLNALEKEDTLPLPLSCLKIESYLLKGDVQKAGLELMRFPLEWHTKETTLLPYLYGCWLILTEGKELGWVHFAGTLEVSYPRSWTLGSLSLIEKLPYRWEKKAFTWEKKELYRQLSLYHALQNDGILESSYLELIEDLKTNPATI